jgi:Uma2 family endonuclease
LGEVFFAPLNVIFDAGDVVEPDVIFVSNERVGIVTHRGLEEAPDWVIEVVSPGTRKRDLQTKRKLCQSFGVEVYWAVDPEMQEIHAWDGSSHNLYEMGEVARASSLPRFMVELAVLFS